MPSNADDEDEERGGGGGGIPAHRPRYSPFAATPIPINPTTCTAAAPATTRRPLHAPLLIHNEQSEVRDFCANERTFLSYLRLAVYLAIVSTAIILSFHLRPGPVPPAERAAALPLGVAFWVLAVAAFVTGVARYVSVVEGYARRRAVVQSGVATQLVFGVLSVCIVGACVFFIIVD